MKYPLYDMNWDDFEHLVILICNHILGVSTIPFAAGRDGGRDGKFIGKANCVPSEVKPWDGKIIIQAKHTSKKDTSCSDSDFIKIVDSEVIPAVNKLKAANDIDYYILFTNRKLTGDRDSLIERQIKDKIGIPSVLFAEEKIQEFLHTYPDIVRSANLNRLLLPFEFDESDLKDVIISLNKYIKSSCSITDAASFEYPGLEKKNELNKMSKDYFDSIKGSMNDFIRIKTFLSDPSNDELYDLYRDSYNELNAKILLYRDQYYEFEQVIEACYNNIVNDNSSIMKGKKSLVRILLHYMYCNCDIGKKS